jgi:flavorubredoxin
MPSRIIKENIFAVGAIDWDRTLFDALIPLPHGTSYNAYLIKGTEKTALLDTVEPTKLKILQDNLNQLNIHSIDYVISHHAEQDHSGSIPAILQHFPAAQLVTSKKGQDMLIPLLKLPPERFQLIDDRQILPLGGKTLQFIFAPWVHWPETMFSYLMEDKILFSCDLFGSHLASSELFTSANGNTMLEMKRYYAEIMMPFSVRISKHLEMLKTFDIQMIAPSHGPIHDNPAMVFDLYRDWTSSQVKNEVVLLYISMHGSTENIAHYFADCLMQKNVSVKPFNLISASLGEIALALVDAATVIIASPAVLMGPHPNIVYATYLISTLKPKTKYVGILGSFGWGNKMVDQITNILQDLGVEFLPPLLIKGHPREQEYSEIQRFATLIEEKHRLLFEQATTPVKE